jgi:hypothetical protein
MIYKELNSTAKEALNGTTVLNTVALTKGQIFGCTMWKKLWVCNCGLKWLYKSKFSLGQYEANTNEKIAIQILLKTNI